MALTRCYFGFQRNSVHVHVGVSVYLDQCTNLTEVASRYSTLVYIIGLSITTSRLQELIGVGVPLRAKMNNFKMYNFCQNQSCIDVQLLSIAKRLIFRAFMYRTQIMKIDSQIGIGILVLQVPPCNSVNGRISGNTTASGPRGFLRGISLQNTEFKLNWKVALLNFRI